MQYFNITNNKKVEVDFNFPGFSATKIIMWNFHVDESTKIRYDMSLYIYLVTSLGSDVKFSDHIIKEGDRPF